MEALNAGSATRQGQKLPKPICDPAQTASALPLAIVFLPFAEKIMKTDAIALSEAHPEEPERVLTLARKSDIFEDLHKRGLLEALLRDRTTKQGIIWATDTYSELGDGYGKTDQISPALLLGRCDRLKAMRIARRNERTRKHGEVFTPLAVCKRMCDYAYEALRGEDWREYAQTTVLEITCGEAPFLASRRDPCTGAETRLNQRVGILDRKLQVIAERTKSRAEWLYWAFVAFESTYGYEFQGDNLLFARINLLETFEDYQRAFWGATPTESEYLRLLDIISWNIWQMDGLTGTVPFGIMRGPGQASLFEQPGAREAPACRIKDWQRREVVTYLSCGGLH